MVLDCGRRLQYPERTLKCMKRLRKLHAERRLEAGNQTKDFLAAKQQPSKQMENRNAKKLLLLSVQVLL